MRYIRLTEIEWPTTLRVPPLEIPFLAISDEKDISVELFETYGVKPISYKVEIIKDANKAALSILLPGLF